MRAPASWVIVGHRGPSWAIVGHATGQGIADALTEAARGTGGPVDAGRLEVWTKDHWEKVS